MLNRQVFDLHHERQTKWVDIMQKHGGYWLHDGSLKRPYALLTSGMVSNFYANCSVITRQPTLLECAANDLLAVETLRSDEVGPMPDVYIGSAFGAITLAYELARQNDAEAWFTVKDGSGMKLDRFDFTEKIRHVVLVEDVITTFKTTRASIDAIEEKANAVGAKVLPYVLALVNRTGKSNVDGYDIISLVDVSNAKNWAMGHNPFLGDQPERVEPVRPKQHWDALTRTYA